jgi:membrane protease YdiL (CAAX protease family)
VDAPEKVPPESIATCSKCGLESREARKFCPRCGFPSASVFKQPVSKWQSLEPAIKTSAILFAINLLFLVLKITPESIHLPIEIAIELLFVSVILFAVHPIRSKIHFLSRRFFNERFSPWKMASLALVTGVGVHFYFRAFESLGLQTVDYLEKGDLGTAKVPWIFINTVLLAPVFEEIFFRGYLFQKFRLVLNPRDTIILQGLLFGIIHLSPATYISHTIIGILFGYFRYRTKSLLPGMLFHALWNLFIIGTEYRQLLER